MPTKRSTATTTKPRSRKINPPSSPTDTAFSPEALLSLAFLELAPDGILVADSAGHIQLVNQQIEILFGYHRSTLIGQPVEMLLPPRFQARHRKHRGSYMAAPHTRTMGAGLELYGQRQDGSEFTVEVSLSPLPSVQDTLVIAIIRDVTERTRIEHEHQFQAERLRLQAALIDAAHDAILVRDQESRITFWNHGAEEIYGWTRAEVLGQVTHTLFQTRFPVGLSSVDDALRLEGRWEGELEHTRADGRVILVESRQVLLRDTTGDSSAILEINRDITDRKRLEAAERQASQERLMLLQTVLDELPGGAYLVQGEEARLVLANHAAMDVWGVTWPEGQPLGDFLRASGIGYYTEAGQPLSVEELVTLQVAQGGPPVRQQREVVCRPDGTSLPILLSAVPLRMELLGKGAVDGSDRAALVLIQDITQLQALEQLKDQFITVAAHELRTPLTAIQGFASMLTVQTGLGRGPELADWQQEALDEIEGASERMNEIVGDLLDATRIQAGRLELHPVLLELVGTVRRTVTRFQVSTTRHRLTVEAPSERVMVLADGARLEQILGNLVGNAIKYSPDGGPVTITLQVDQEAALAELCVRDAGIGIPAEQQSLLFGRFVRASNVHDHAIAGSGLGLYVCRELVERHGGHIWFESTEGVGTTFFVTLPLAPLPLESTDQDAATPVQPPARQRNGR